MKTALETIQERQAEQHQEDVAGAAAAATPLPGPAFDAFSPQPPRKVGRWLVREFTSGDYELLQVIDSPLQRLLAIAYESSAVDRSSMTGPEQQAHDQAVAKEEHQVMLNCSRGQAAWDLCYLMTTPNPEQFDRMFREQDGKDRFHESARAEFSRLRLGPLGMLVLAVVDAVHASFSTRLGVEPSSAPADGEEAAPSSSPPSSSEPSTASAGS